MAGIFFVLHKMFCVIFLEGKKMRVIIRNNYDECSKWAANHIAGRINAANPTADKPFVIGLPTGSTPLGTYKELINLYKAGISCIIPLMGFRRP